MLAVLMGFAGLVFGTQAAVSVGPTGAGPITFDNQPAVADWSTAQLPGASTNILTIAQITSVMQANPASAIGGTLPASSTLPPSAFGVARWNNNPQGLFLQTKPTGVALLVLMATLQNDSGADLSEITVAYDLGVFAFAPEEIPGHVGYYSLSGATNSWQRIPGFTVTNAGRVTVPLTLGVWPAGSRLYLVWVDDNGDGVTDPAYTIDNFTVTVSTVPEMPAEVVDDSSLTNRTVLENQPLTLSFSARGNPAPTYQWYHNGSPVQNLSECANGHIRIITNATRPNLTFNAVQPSDAGDYRCVVSNPLGTDETVTFRLTVTPDTTPPRILYAVPGASPTEFVIYFSEPLNDSCLDTSTGGPVTDHSTWAVDEIIPGVGAQSLFISAFTNRPNVTGATVLGLTTINAPTDPANPIRIMLQIDLTDSSAAQNVLPANTTVYVLNSSNQLVALDQNWHYNDQDFDPGPDWFLPDFDPGIFPQGPGPFDAKRSGTGTPHFQGNASNCRLQIYTNYGIGPTVGTCLNLTSPLTQTNLITANFWTRFHYSGLPAHTLLRWHGKMDDGAVIYLNGQELQRLRMPAAPAPITRSTFSTGAVIDSDPEDFFEFLAPSALRTGQNYLAVELHQQSLASSDLTMGMRMYALTAPLPRLEISASGQNVTLTWAPAVGELQYRTNLDSGTWTTIPGATSGYSEAIGSVRRFYRIVLP